MCKKQMVALFETRLFTEMADTGGILQPIVPGA